MYTHVHMYTCGVCACVCMCMCVRVYAQWTTPLRYEVASVSRLLKIVGIFCKRALEKRRHSAKETYQF